MTTQETCCLLQSFCIGDCGKVLQSLQEGNPRFEKNAVECSTCWSRQRFCCDVALASSLKALGQGKKQSDTAVTQRIPIFQIWGRKTMDRPNTAGEVKGKSLFQDSDGSTVPVKSVCHNCSKLKIFLGALAFSFFAKGFSGSYMKSMSSQIERRFEISSSIVGIIDGSFEIGNLMVMVLVSYLGPRVHRPKVIAVGCLIMSLGAFLSVLPQFLMGRYNYERITVTVDNSSTSVSACSPAPSQGHPVTDATETLSTMKNFGLVRSSGMFGPTLGFLLGSFCASLWVDIGVVDIDTISINPKDTRWVGAWWLGLLLCGAVNFVASLPFWFLPYSLPKEGEKENLKINHISIQGDHCKTDPPAQPQLKFSEAVKDFFPALKKLFGNPVFLVYIFLTILQYNSLVGLITYETKFMEQQFNVSVARAIFLIGVILLPITILGMFLGGFLIKKFKLHITKMAKFACITFVAAYLLNLFYFICSCEVLQVAGLTVPYSGLKHLSFPKNSFKASCNADCSCKLDQWDPVCGADGITYMTACFAGCKSSTGMGKNMVFHNCSCVEVQEHGLGNSSAVLGQCQRESCTKAFPYFLALQTACAFILGLGGTPTYMIMFRSVSPDLKSFAVGIETLGGRVLGGLPAPIYFGALIDETCLKWGTKNCGGSGSCRVYDTKAFRNVYLGLIAGLRAGCCLLYIVLCVLITKRFKPDGKEMTDTKNIERPTSKESATDNKKEILPGARISEESEETCM
uniref:Solute carrier organic anion transporter family member n=1 Tax=Falco tinnunculus TaxID=100819 RepID=A0A8C4XNN7_FALTI